MGKLYNEKEELIIDEKLYQRYVRLDVELMIENTEFKYSDFLTSEGWIDFKKLDERAELNIVLITGNGTGKTYGCFNYYLNKHKNVSMITNTKQVADQNILQLLDTLKLNSNHFEAWGIESNVIIDDEANKRVKAYSLRNYGSVKGGRDFYSPIVVYDEFNQEAKQASIKGQSPTLALDTVINRVSDRNNQIKHCYYFANKDSPQPLLTTPILFDLGVYGLNEFSEVFIVKKRFLGNFINTTLVINQRFNEADVQRILNTWSKDPDKYKKEINQYFNGSASIAYFNNDKGTNWLLDRISIDCPFESYAKYIVFRDKRYYLLKTDKENLWIREIKRPENDKVWVFNNRDLQENRQVLPFETCWAIDNAISKSKIVFSDVKTKYYWYNK